MMGNQLRLVAAGVAVCILLGGAFADSVSKTDGTLLSGEVVSLQDGVLRLKTDKGVQEIPLDSVKAFTVDEKKQSAVSDEAVNRLLVTQDHILQRLDFLTQSLGNLERQLLNVQTTQQVNADRLTQRTQEVNPLGRLIVGAYQVNRATGRTVVTGQVFNQSETPMSNIQVDVFIYGSTGKIRAEGGMKKVTVYPTPSNLGPGQAGTFSAAFRDQYQVDRVTFDVRGLPPYGYSANPPTGRAATGDF